VPVPDAFEPDVLEPDVPVLLPLLRFVLLFEEFEPLLDPVELLGAPLELELFVFIELELV
jgi:hypothetical protein